MRAREKTLAAFDIDGPDQASGCGDVLGARQIPEQGEPEKILVPLEKSADCGFSLAMVLSLVHAVKSMPNALIPYTPDEAS